MTPRPTSPDLVPYEQPSYQNTDTCIWLAYKCKGEVVGIAQLPGIDKLPEISDFDRTKVPSTYDESYWTVLLASVLVEQYRYDNPTSITVDLEDLAEKISQDEPRAAGYLITFRGDEIISCLFNNQSLEWDDWLSKLTPENTLYFETT